MTEYNSSDNQNITQEKAGQARIAYWTSIAAAIIMAVAGIAIVLSTWIFERVDIVSGVIACILAILATISAWLSRHKHHEEGAGLLLLSILILLIPLPLVLPAGTSLLIMATAVVVGAGLGLSTMTEARANYAISAGYIAGVTSVLVDIFAPVVRQSGPLQTIAFIIVFIFLGLFGYQVIINYAITRLRTKLVLTFLVITLIPMAILTYLNDRTARRLLIAQTSQSLITTSSQAATAVDSFIKIQLDIIRTEAKLSEFIDYLGLPRGEREGSIEEQKVREALNSLSQRDPVFISSFALLDEQGVDTVDTYAVDTGINKSGRDYFQQPIATGLPSVSPVRFSPTVPDLLSIYFSSPVRSLSGEIIGVLRVRYKADVLQSILVNSTLGSPPGQYSVLLEDQYFIRIAHSKETNLLLKSYTTFSPTNLSDLYREGRFPPGNPEDITTDQPDVVEGLKNIEVNPIFSAEGEAIGGDIALSGAIRLKEVPWILMTRQSQSLAFVPVRSQTQAALALVLLITIAVVLVSIGLSRLLSSPILQLTEVAERVAKGELSARAPLESMDEIGTLTTTFNSMTEQLEQTLTGLEQRVADRTRAIELSADVSRRLSTILDQQQLATEVVELLQSAFDYYHVHIYLYDEPQENLVMVGGTGEPGQKMLASGHKIPRGRGLVGQASEVGSVVLVSDTMQDPRWLPNPLLPDTKSEVAVPIMIGNLVMGVLDVQQNIVGGIEQQDIDLLLNIANQVAIALRNAQLYSEAQYRAEQETTIRAIEQQIQSTQTIEDALKITIRELGRVVSAPNTHVRLQLQRDDVRIEEED